ncbi:MAG: hypothetical protein ACRDUX_35580 [Mycobacterium sp.]
MDQEEKLLLNSVARLVAGPAHDVELYLDERGTPGTDRRFITAGVLVHGTARDVATAWTQYWNDRRLGGKKGRDLTRDQLINVAEFLITQPVLPVAVFSLLDPEELDQLRAFAVKFKASKSPLKKFKKMSPASWLWKCQMNQALIHATASFLAFRGRIGRGVVYHDEMHEEPEKREHFRRAVVERTHSRHVQTILHQHAPAPVAKMLARSLPGEWRIEMSSKGALARLADVICAMFGRFLEDEWREPWEVLRLTHRRDSREPPCLGREVTDAVRAWLAKLYESSDPDR